jgi:hypothetical protein
LKRLARGIVDGIALSRFPIIQQHDEAGALSLTGSYVVSIEADRVHLLQRRPFIVSTQDKQNELLRHPVWDNSEVSSAHIPALSANRNITLIRLMMIDEETLDVIHELTLEADCVTVAQRGCILNGGRHSDYCDPQIISVHNQHEFILIKLQTETPGSTAAVIASGSLINARKKEVAHHRACIADLELIVANRDNLNGDFGVVGQKERGDDFAPHCMLCHPVEWFELFDNQGAYLLAPLFVTHSPSPRISGW